MITGKINKLLKEHERLKDKRHPMFERNRFMKFLAYFMLIYYAGCMLLIGFTLPRPMSEAYHGVPGFDVLGGYFFIILIIDFWIRFVAQETPANVIRPYSLLPISKNYLLRRHLRRAGLTTGNLFWGFFLVPFAFMSVFRTLGFMAVVGWLLGWWMLVVADSYLYLLIRALCTRTIKWIVLPLLLHAAVLLAAFLPDTNLLDDVSTAFMRGFAEWNPPSFTITLTLIIILFRINMRVQGVITYDEVGKKEDVQVKNASQMAFLNRFGIVGEYLKLEMKMKMRNRLLKTQFFVLLGCMLLLSGILYFTDIYDGVFMTSFICLYDYIVPGMATLITILCLEGNYMDLLMSRRESILDLLSAKYYFYSALLLIPFFLLIPLTWGGKVTLGMNLGYLFFTVGVLYPMMFQMAAYNKETLPLNAKLGTKSGSGMQNIISIVIMFLPIAFERLVVTLLGDPWGYVLLIAVGLVGVLTHRHWLRFTYRRFMARRYQNMEGFRATRKSS